MHRAASAPIRTLLWRHRVASLLLNDSRAALLSRSAQLLSSSSSRGFASLPEGVEELTMPALSPTMTVGNISAWLKKEGEQLQAGDVLCQIETDKAVVDYEMQDEAVLAAIVLPEGTPDIPVGGVLAYTVEDMETYESLLSSGALKALKDAPPAAASGSVAPVAETPSPAAAVTPAPAAHAGRQPLIKFLGKRSLLPEAEHAATPASATTSAPAVAAVTPVAAPAAAPATAPATEAGDDFTDIALSNMRKIIAKRLTASKVTVPHHYASIDCEIDNIMKLRQKLKSAHSVKVSLNDFIIKAVALALRDVPEANCYFDVATKGVQPNKSVDISVAVATATGLITPIVPKVDAIGLSEVNSIFMELVSRARQNKLKPEEFQGGSFTISNLGGFGIDNFTAVINPPQACIMAIGRGRKEVLPPLEIVEGVDPEPRVATLMNVTLSADRRVVDDVISGQFLQVFKSYMENPELMVLAFSSRASFLNKKSPAESRPAVQHLSSMSELQLIVEQLNKEPFRLGLTLVAFDEKSNFELLQILNEVFTEIDAKHNVDLRNEADEQRAYRYLEFLQLLKFPLPRDIESFREALIHGDRQVLYPILHWALKNLAGHKKRAYLGRFLAPLNVPQEYFGNESLNGMYEHYKQLQEQFKAVHKEVDQLRASKTRPGELRKEITQLEEEAQQLQEKIANLKKKTASESGFKDILEATSALRKEQEEQAKLAERKRDQMMSLTLVEKRSRECEQRLMDLRSSLSHDTPPEQLFEHLKSQVERNRDILVVKFPQEFRLQQENLQRLERALSEPPKTEADIADMEDEIASLKSSIQHFQAQIADAQKNSGGDDKLGIYRQHASVQVKKLTAKEDELDALRTEKAKMQKQIEELEAKMSEVSGGAKFMSRDEFKQYANLLRNKTNQYKKVKVELAELTAESVVLHRTEQLLKSKDADLDGFLKDMEAKKGVTGFLDTQEKLDNISEMNAQVNKLKGETLEEISRIVTDINQTLKERKNQLAPQIKELRAVRQRYQEMEQSYLEKKAQYDNTAVGLETERIKLEQECNAFQEDCLREESQYHLLHCLLQIEQGKVDKIEQEMAFEKGDGRLLRDIKSFQELYKHKVAQQESLTKELRKQQKTLKSNTADHHAQREQFEGLFKLLNCKVKLAGRAGAEAAAMAKGGELFDGHADIAQFENVGGANVMTLDA